MYWYKKISDDTGNPELNEKDNEDTDKQAQDMKPHDVAMKDEEVKNEQTGSKNKDKQPAEPAPQSMEGKESGKLPARPQKILEPVEEVKMKKELNDLQFTYVL